MERTAGLEPATSASGTPCAASCATSALLSQPVSRVLSPVDRPGDGHPSRAAVAGGLKHPTCEHRAGNSLAFWACSGRGLPGRPGHPGRRWSLTPPFHPYPPRRAVYSLLHLPSGHPGPALPASLPCGARTFLGTPARGDAAVRPTQALMPVTAVLELAERTRAVSIQVNSTHRGRRPLAQPPLYRGPYPAPNRGSAVTRAALVPPELYR